MMQLKGLHSQELLSVKKHSTINIQITRKGAYYIRALEQFRGEPEEKSYGYIYIYV